MFHELASMKGTLGSEDNLIVLLRALLYSNMLKTPYDLRGRRKIKLILDFFQVLLLKITHKNTTSQG